MNKQRKKMFRRILPLCAIFAITITLIVPIGCQTPPPPYVPKALIAPELIHCNDYTGHKPGSKPWVMGGTCTCTPTPELMNKLHADGFCLGMDTEQLRQLYENKGIKLRGPGHLRCNGLCDHGPHVVLGGKCMCPPTPGTEYYEKVITGKRESSLP